MEIGRVKGCTRVLGKSQGYYGLPVRDELVNSTVTGPETPVMTTAWFPTPDELAAINAGAPIHLRIVGTAHPPVMMGVGDAPFLPPPHERERQRRMKPEQIDALINGMCLTWRHDFGIPAVAPDDEGRVAWCDGLPIGMTQKEKDGLRLQMRQLYEHHIRPAILGAIEEERAKDLAEISHYPDAYHALFAAIRNRS